MMPALKKIFSAFVLFSATSIGFTSATKQPEELPTIAEIAASSKRFDTLVKLALQAGLFGVLDGPGTFTCIAPTDAAFRKANDAVSVFAQPEYSLHLQELLLYHTLSFEAYSDDAPTDPSEVLEVDTIQGESLAITVTNSGGIRVNDARVRATDIKASNGVIHVINRVLLPSFATKSIFKLSTEDSNFSIVSALLEQSGLDELLDGTDDGPFTVFAPTNDAFAELSDDVVKLLQDDEDGEILKKILSFHVVPGIVYSSMIADGSKAKTALGRNIQFQTFYGDITVNNGADVIDRDVLASNGVIHVIDTVLIPKNAL